MEMATSPAPTSLRARRTAGLALAITVVLAIAKLAVWAATGSLAVLSQALDSVLDIVALALVWIGVRISGKPADETHHYGHAKAENLVAFTQTLLLGTVVVAVVIEAIRRLSGEPPDLDVPWYAFALLATSAVVDGARAAALWRVARETRSEALRAGALNLVTDVGTAVVALISIGAVRAGMPRADSVGGLVVAAAVAIAAYRIGRVSVDALMDRAPSLSAQEIEAAAAAAPGVAETRRVRLREAGNQMFADVTVAAGRTTSLERAHDIAEGVEQAIAEVAPGTDVVVHVEPMAETSGLAERAAAAASRTEGVREVHNVLVHAFDEGGSSKLHVTLHAKVAAGLSLANAHDISDDIEARIERELGPSVRVDSHIEPLDDVSSGRDVTGSRPELVRNVTALATQEPDVLDCHEVLVTSTDGGLSIVAHVRGAADLPLSRIHAASERIEKAIHARHPEVGPVTIHFEPA